jgi:hypothetical protein
VTRERIVGSLIYRPGQKLPPPIAYERMSIGAYVAYRFRIAPRQAPHIAVVIDADWTANRSSQSCWLVLPKLLGESTNSASIAANEAIGHEIWVTRQVGFPLRSAGVYLNENGLSSALPVSPTASLPVPTSLDPPAWTCNGKETPSVSDCQVFAALGGLNEERSRSRALSLWAVLAGLLLALFGDSAIGIIRAMVVGNAEESPRRPDV